MNNPKTSLRNVNVNKDITKEIIVPGRGKVKDKKDTQEIVDRKGKQKYNINEEILLLNIAVMPCNMVLEGSCCYIILTKVNKYSKIGKTTKEKNTRRKTV